MPKLDRLDPNSLRHNPRCTLDAWEKYRPWVLSAYRMHPRPYIFSPSNISAITVCSRIRDAIRGALAFGYDIDSGISHEDLFRWWGEVIVRAVNAEIHIGPKARVVDAISATDNVFTPPFSFNFPTLSLEEVIAFTVLLSTQRITGPVVIQQPPDLSLLPPRNNVETLSRPDGSLILL